MTSVATATAFGRRTGDLVDAACAGRAGFGPVTVFDTAGRRTTAAAVLPDRAGLLPELAGAIRAATAGLTTAERAAAPLLLAAHADPALLRSPDPARAVGGAAGHAVKLAADCGLGPALRAYTTGCVAASTAVIDAALMIVVGRAERVVVAAGYLVEPDLFGVFDAGRALARGGSVRPFSAGRDGLLLGDGIAAVVLESPAAAADRGAPELARLVGWGRSGDAHHVCQPRPDGTGLARAIAAALARAGLVAEEVDYVNAHGSGTPQSDAAEAAALLRALGGHGRRVPVSSTKSVHGHTLEAAGLVELAVTVLALGSGRLPVNANWLGPDERCPLALVLAPTAGAARHALSVNAAFGGANTALVVRAA